MAELEDPEEDSMIFIELLKAIEDNYQPVKTIAEADVFLTTQQILDNLSGMDPKIDIGKLSDFLLQAGYVIEDLGGLQFAWLLQTRAKH